MPLSGNFNYSILGATTPTLTPTAGGPPILGQLASATLGVTFYQGTESLSLTVNTVFNGTTSTIYASTCNVSGGRFNGSSNGTVNGMFVGTGASKAGVVYSYSGGSGVIGGAISFSKATANPTGFGGC